MNRRTMLAGAGSLGALGTGIVGYELFQHAPPTPNPVTNVEFDASTVRLNPRNEEGPTIEISSTESKIEVSGAFYVGNECYAARIDDIEHIADELIITIDGKQRPFWERGIGCDDAGVANEYRLTVAVDTMPDVVTVIELGLSDEHRTRVETAS